MISSTASSTASRAAWVFNPAKNVYTPPARMVRMMQGTPREIFSQVDKMKYYGLDVPQVTETAYNLRKMGIDIPQDILTVDEMVGAICRLKSTI